MRRQLSVAVEALDAQCGMQSSASLRRDLLQSQEPEIQLKFQIKAKKTRIIIQNFEPAEIYLLYLSGYECFLKF